LGVGEPLVGRLLLYDALAMRFRELKLRRNPECPVCGDSPTITKLIDYQEFCGVRAQEPLNNIEVDVLELKKKLDRKEEFILLDVREPHEVQIGRIPGSILIPLGDLEKRSAELDRLAEIIVHCKSGARSSKAVEYLTKAGYSSVKNLTGGILAWSDKVDPSVPKY
jgi:rhodanese-related sulfurtransferase